MCLQAFIAISEELRPVDVFKRLENVILAPLRLSPRAEEGPVKKFFLHIFSWVRAMTPSIFQIEISKKNWKKIPPQGGLTPKFFVSNYSCMYIPPLRQCTCIVSARYLKNCSL